MKILKIIFIIVLIGLVVADYFIHPHHPHFFWDEIPGVHALIGIVAALVFVYLSKVLGGLFIQQREDYYERNKKGEDRRI